MPERMRATNWSATPLGPEESWSPALRTTVRLLLANRSPLLLWWGPDHVSIYNDACRQLFGTTDPCAVGRPARECWGDTWHTLQPLIETPFRGGPATQSDDIELEINRRGLAEEAHVTATYSPVPDDTAPGGIGGVLAALHDITDRIVAERRMGVLRDLRSAVGDAATAAEVCTRAAHALAAHEKDVPFALVYLSDAERRQARLAGATGIAQGTDIAPPTIDLSPGAPSTWPVRLAIEADAPQTVNGLGEMFAAVPAGPWSDPPGTAVVLPIGSDHTAQPIGVVIVGVSPRLAFDEGYREHLDLIRTLIAGAIARARGRADEGGRSDASAEGGRASTLLARAPLGMFLVDADCTIREVNPVALAAFGNIPGGVVGRGVDEILHTVLDEAYADEVIRSFRRTLDTGEPYVAAERARYRRERGVTGYFEWRLDRVTLPDGRFGVACYSRDISEQKESAAAKAYLAAIIESADAAIIAKDLDGTIQWCNPAAERLFGYTADELIGRQVRILIPPDRQAEEDDILARLRRGERLEHFETIRVTKDGRPIAVSLTVSPVRDDTGRVVGASKIVHDITEERRAEAERVRLIQEHAAVMEALNHVGAMVASDLDRTKVVQAVTDAGTELTTAEFGAFFYNLVDEQGEFYTPHTISGAPRGLFSRFPMPRDTAVFEATFKGLGVVRSADITRDPRYGHNAPYQGMPPGHLPVRSYLAVPVRGRGGEVIGGLFFGHAEIGRFTDQHERLAVGMASWASVAFENAELYSSMQEANRTKDEFLATLSHELRTPLNAILGYARMLNTGTVAPDRQKKAIDTIERNATSLTQIVEDVLDISRIVSGKMRLDVQPVDLPDVVRSALDSVRPAADARGIRVESIVDPQAAPVSGDPERLQQIMWNLLSNAVKFTNRGGRVQVRLARVESHVEMTVSDTGIGIAAEFLPHVFDRFRQADSRITRERGGLGLGLAIARQLTEMHGGGIDVTSRGAGEGATFRVTLPLMIVHPAPGSEARLHPLAGSRAGIEVALDLRTVHVLAVDDEPDALALLREVLEAAGARVTSARSGLEALSALDRESADVLVADIGMPRFDGFALIARVRSHADERIRRIPAAALTAYARSEDRMKALRAGFQIHLAKPIDPAELVTTIASLAKRIVQR